MISHRRPKVGGDNCDYEDNNETQKQTRLKEKVLAKLYPQRSPSPAASSSSSSSDKPRSDLQLSRMPPPKRLYTAAADPQLPSDSAAGGAADTTIAVLSCCAPAATDSCLSSDEEPDVRRRRQRRKQRAVLPPPRSSAPDIAVPEGGSHRERDDVASVLSKNHKRKLKKRRHKDRQRTVIQMEAVCGSAPAKAKEFYFDNCAEVREKQKMETEKRETMITKIEEFVRSVADLHSFQTHTQWDTSLAAFSAEILQVDQITLTSLLLVKTLLVLNDQGQARAAIATCLDGTSGDCSFTSDVNAMLNTLFEYWIKTMMS